MSDDNKASEGVEKKAEASFQQETETPKSYSEEQFKEVVGQRDKLKSKLRDIEEKDRKAAEAKAIEEGRLKEVLAEREKELESLRRERDARIEAETKRRTEVLDRITDPQMRKFAEKLSDATEIQEFIDTFTKEKLTTHTTKAPQAAPERPKFKSFRDWEAAVQGGGGVLGGPRK